MPISKSIDWQIESLRVTVFVNGQLNSTMLENWLVQVSENSPLQVSKMPSSFSGISRSRAGLLRINWIENRLDVLLSSEEPMSNISIASISDASALFNQFIDRVPDIDELPLVDRVALGLVLTFNVPSESEGLEILSHNIVGLNLHPSARDFLYRVNHPSKSKNNNALDINRLAIWSVGRARVIHFQLMPNGSQSQEIVSEDPPAIRLELDINTDIGVLLGANLEQLRMLLKELQEIAINIAHDGESAMQI
jgi:hypothetical protein